MTNTDTMRAIRAQFDTVTDATTTAYDALESGMNGIAFAAMLNARDALNATIEAMRPMMEWNK